MRQHCISASHIVLFLQDFFYFWLLPQEKAIVCSNDCLCFPVISSLLSIHNGITVKQCGTIQFV